MLACCPLLQSVEPARYWQKRVRKAIKVLNPLRDLQQMQTRLAGEPLLAAPIEQQIERAIRRWQRYQPKMNSDAFLLALKTSTKRLKKIDTAQKALLLEIWREQWRRTLHQVRKRLDAAEINDLKTLHRLRIRYKRLRYLLELLLEAGATLDVDATALKYWQEIFGDIEDYRVTALLVKKMHGPSTLQQRFAQQAQEKANQFMKQRENFARFLSALDQQL